MKCIWCPCKKLGRDRARGKTHEDGSRDWNDTSANQGKPRAAGNHQKLGKEHEIDSPAESSGGASCADTLISDFQPPEQSENKCLLL